MSDTPGIDRLSSPSVRATARQAFLAGFALTIPLFVTLLVIGFVVNSLSNVLDPVVAFAFRLSGSRLQPSETPPFVLKLVALTVLLVTVFCIGLVSERHSGRGRIESVFDATMERIPGIGSIYTSFDEMSRMLLDSDTQSFQEVVLIEHPTADAYTMAFVTANTPESIEQVTGHPEMVTVFMPMAPNPVMGGHVVHLPTDRVYDVDMTVEEGLRSIVTSGVAIGEGEPHASLGESGTTTGTGYPQAHGFHAGRDHREPTPRTDESDRESAYADDTDHPDAFDRQDGTLGSETDTPSDIEPTEEEQS